MKYLRIAFALLALSGCATTGNKSVEKPIQNEESDYVVRERVPDPAPAWIQNFPTWKKDNERNGVFYFLGESGDVSDRIAGCDIAALQAKKKISEQIAQLITNKIAADQQGRLAIDPTDSTDSLLKGAFESQLAGKSIAFLSGAREHSTYWERRDYSQSNGRKRAFNCAVVVSISGTDYQAAVSRSRRKAVDMVDETDAKAAVKESLKDLDKDFANYQPKSN